ncbi:DUF2099 family protein [Methanoplanus sp. FWC-SCC4]|uniref:DUF2099 family protein n=1 Tax=Methanochimaera problematica TaxID=2609417 RepID=A0AA97FCU8_9EURY|nr:methanogenesis marker 8 protein [Methanoplanus sp. FWC-SCC4]WOF15873.1 DUF2099 family protein [Methanoplanus sp. FWC-SCC4]
MIFTDEHIIEAAGKTRVVVRDGRVVEVGSPLIGHCPLAKKFKSPVVSMSQDEIRKNIEERISSFGMCTRKRCVISGDDFVLFGASELLSSALLSKIIDCAVIACDGAGTVIAKNPELIQGIGGKMSGLVKTCPYEEVIKNIESNEGFVPFKEDASIDPFGGVEKALELGFSKIAVTVASSHEAEKIRQKYPETVIVAVHTTGAEREDAVRFTENSDIISACASSFLREIAGPKALVQGGSSVPVYAMTENGKKIVLSKIQKTKMQVLLKGEILPFTSGKDPSPLI